MKLEVIGAIALVGLMLHAINHALHGTGWEILWACNVATAVLAAGCFMKNARLVAIPFLWLCFGTPIWLLDLASGGVFMITSLLTHGLALALGFVAVRKLGMPPHTWPLATVLLVGVMLTTRFTSPPALNINLSRAVWTGWENIFPRYDVYFAVVVGGFAATFLVVERLMLKLTGGTLTRARSSETMRHGS